MDDGGGFWQAGAVVSALSPPEHGLRGRWVARLHRADGTTFVYTGIGAFGFATSEEAEREGARFAKTGERVESVFLTSS